MCPPPFHLIGNGPVPDLTLNGVLVLPLRVRDVTAVGGDRATLQ